MLGFVCKVVNDVANFSVYDLGGGGGGGVLRKRFLSEIVEIIIIKLGMVNSSHMVMHYVLIIFTLTFIQDHTDCNHENNKWSIISKTVEAIPITFAVKIVRLKV